MSSAGAIHEYRPSQKPTASCTSCRRRKLRCDREPQGCRNCCKAELPCLYPPAEETAKRKRGPYQKYKTQRERELGHAVKAMEVKCEQLAGQVQNQSDSQANPAPKYGPHEGFFMLPNGNKKASTGTNTPHRSSDQFPRSSTSGIDAEQLQMRLSTANPPTADNRDLRLKNRFWSNFSNEVSRYSCHVSRPMHSLTNTVRSNQRVDQRRCRNPRRWSGSRGRFACHQSTKRPARTSFWSRYGACKSAVSPSFKQSNS